MKFSDAIEGELYECRSRPDIYGGYSGGAAYSINGYLPRDRRVQELQLVQGDQLTCIGIGERDGYVSAYSEYSKVGCEVIYKFTNHTALKHVGRSIAQGTPTQSPAIRSQKSQVTRLEKRLKDARGKLESAEKSFEAAAKNLSAAVEKLKTLEELHTVEVALAELVRDKGSGAILDLISKMSEGSGTRTNEIQAVVV